LKYRITRTALEIIRDSGILLKRVGIFTRSPLIEQDLPIFKQLGNVKIHFTITPYSHEDLHKLEPIAVSTERRLESVQKLQAQGMSISVNIAPIIPHLSDPILPDLLGRLLELGITNVNLDPMTPYEESWQATKEAMKDHPLWGAVEDTMQNQNAFWDWKYKIRSDWENLRETTLKRKVQDEILREALRARFSEIENSEYLPESDSTIC
jgi:DNA repair photolyase